MPAPGRIAITGAGGFVGRHLTVVASADRDVVGVVRSEEGAGAVLEAGGLPARVPRLDPGPLVRAFGGARAVVHLAQIGAEQAGASYEAVNVGGTRAVVEAAREAGVARIVFLSGLGVARYGMTRRCTNPYFLSKLAAEMELYRSGLEVVVFRPSYVLGPGGGLVPRLLREMAAGEVERVGDGRYRLQPIGVRDVAGAILAAIDAPAPGPAVYDLVGPEPLAFHELIERVARVARAEGRKAEFQIREIPVEEADRRAAAGGYRGMLRDELDCLLCDEVSVPGPLEALLGRFLTPLEGVLSAAVRGASGHAASDSRG